jgi:peroxiredoxin
MLEALAASQVMLGVVVLFNVVLTLALVRRINEQPRSPLVGLRAGDEAPDFSIGDLTGVTVTLSEFSSGRLLLLFVAPNCVPCERGLPDYLALAPVAKASGVELVLVSSGDAASTSRMLRGLQVSTRVLIAPKGEVDMFDRYKVPGTPHFTLVDRGRVVQSGLPSPKAQEWSALLSGWREGKDLTTTLLADRGR